jgi:hypothetical protein
MFKTFSCRQTHNKLMFYFYGSCGWLSDTNETILMNKQTEHSTIKSIMIVFQKSLDLDFITIILKLFFLLKIFLVVSVSTIF